MTVAVALSGGIDSLVAAWLLKKNRIPVLGIHFITGYESLKHRALQADSPQTPRPEVCEHASRVEMLADRLGIPLYIADCREVFEQRIVSYFIRSYRNGITPNPCVLCNRVIKFGEALEFAGSHGAEFLATGHYAAVDRSGGGPVLRKGADPHKDQSYFLSMLTRSQLSRAMFPLGDLTKGQVRQIAEENDLEPVSAAESQDICFILEQNYSEFLEKKAGITPGPGPIIDIDGTRIGRHAGLHRYTIGQRRGINCPAGQPYYVVRIEPEHNQLVVGFKNTLYKNTCRLNNVNWLMQKPDKPAAVKAKIRYRHREADALVEPKGAGRALLRFAEPQAAVTPGQVAVCYAEDAVAAAGWIENPETSRNE